MLCWLEDKNIKPDVFQFIGADPMGVRGLDPNRNLVAGSVLWLGPPQKFHLNKFNTRMWANAQRDGRPAEHRWRPLVNAAKFG